MALSNQRDVCVTVSDRGDGEISRIGRKISMKKISHFFKRRKLENDIIIFMIMSEMNFIMLQSGQTIGYFFIQIRMNLTRFCNLKSMTSDVID